jgi:hypothetical protein
MFTTAEDWFDRFKAAGCSMQLDVANMTPSKKSPQPPLCSEIWEELRGRDTDKWDQVLAYAKAKAGGFVGYTWL